MPRGALHHHCDDVLRMVIWSETSEPRHVFLLSTISGLRSACFPRYHPIFQTRSAACAAIFINDLPKALANQFDVLRGDFLAQVRSHPRRWRSDLRQEISPE